nr:4'-phosphopantetheinyl transferase superfamily protein [uncultured Sediminibacterium sp.]
MLTLLWSAKEAMFKWWGNGDVDFSEVLRIHELPAKEKGVVAASFIKQTVHPLQLHYSLFGNLTLVWTKGDMKQKNKE